MLLQKKKSQIFKRQKNSLKETKPTEINQVEHAWTILQEYEVVKALRQESFDTSFFVKSTQVVHQKNQLPKVVRKGKFCKIFGNYQKDLLRDVTKIDDDKEDEIYWRFWPRDNKTFFYCLSPAVVVEVGFGIGHH